MGDEFSALAGVVRHEQSERLGIFEQLVQRLKNERMREKRVRAIRAEIDRRRQIYEAAWVELGNAIGGRAAETIRSEIERSVEPVRHQVELPLAKDENFDVEGEERCSK